MEMGSELSKNWSRKYIGWLCLLLWLKAQHVKLIGGHLPQFLHIYYWKENQVRRTALFLDLQLVFAPQELVSTPSSEPVSTCDTEYPLVTPMDLTPSPELPRGPMTRSRARAIGTEVNSLLSQLLFDPLETWMLPKNEILCILRYNGIDHGEAKNQGQVMEEEEREEGEEEKKQQQPMLRKSLNGSCSLGLGVAINR